MAGKRWVGVVVSGCFGGRSPARLEVLETAFDELRVELAWQQIVDRGVVPCDVSRHPANVAGESCAGAVRKAVHRHPCLDHVAGDVDDLPATTFDHAGQRGVDQFDGAEQVGADGS